VLSVTDLAKPEQNVYRQEEYGNPQREARASM